MTLVEIVRQLDQFDRAMTIYAANPWQPSTDALVARPREDGGVPDKAVAAGCAYFLEVFMALAVLHDLPGVRGGRPNDTERCAKLIEYAEWLRSDSTDYPFLQWKFPVNMMIYCSGCGKHFDIVVTSKDWADHRCPACGMVHPFCLEALIKKAMQQGKRMLRKAHGQR
jgi:hypothetical protein